MTTTTTKRLSALLPVQQRCSGIWVVRLLSALLVLTSGTYVSAAGGWSTPVTLSTPVPPSFYTTSPVVAINSSGAQAAVWINEDTSLRVQVATQDAGGSWSQARTLTSSNDDAGSPAVAIGPGGNAVAMWDSFRSGQGVVIKSSARSAHGSWGPIVTLSPVSNSDSATSPKIGMDGNGNAVAIWLLDTGTSTSIQAAYLPVGGSWTTPVPISTPGVTARRPSLAVNAIGDAIAGWETASGQVLVAERKSGVWGAPVSIAPAAYRQNASQVSLNGRGDAAVVWSRAYSSFVSTRDVGGSWSAPTTISTRSAGGSVSIALDDSGNAVLVFVSLATPNANPVEAISRPAGGSWSAPTTISSASEAALAPRVVATPAGTFVVGWDSVTSNTLVAAIRAAGQTTFGAPASLGTGAQLELAIAAGHAAATWLGSGPAVQVSENNLK
jgi:hypothetical protein